MSETFKYFNPNPDVKFDKKTGKPKTWRKGDCVIRAFACALNFTWSKVFNEICILAAKMFDMPNDPKVIEKFALQNNFSKVSLPDYITVRRFCETHKNGVYIVNIRSHVACVKNGQINDTWDCGLYKMKTYYTLSK